MQGIDLFCGAGGLSLGASMAGVDIRYAIDSDIHALQTYKNNFPNTQVILANIKKLETLPNLSKKPTILFGGLPCQGFSSSNSKTRSIQNENNWLYKDFIRLLKNSKMDFILIENVMGLVNFNKGLLLEEILSLLERMNYSAQYWILNAMDYGIPQKRVRLFILGSLEKMKIPIPLEFNNQYISVKEAISDLPILNNGDQFEKLPYGNNNISGYAKDLRNVDGLCYDNYVTKNSSYVFKRYCYVPQGGNWKNIPNYLMRNYTDSEKCHTAIYHRLDENKPSVVIGNYRKTMLIHPTQNRGLSVREAARLQSFPDWFRFHGSIGFRQQQVGNAVPPKLAYIVFKQIMKLV